MIKYILTNYHEYKRLKIELDLMGTKLSGKYPVVNIITNHLRSNSYDIKELETKLEVYYGTDKSKNNTDNS